MRAPSSPSTRRSTGAAAGGPRIAGCITPPPADREKGWVIALAVDPANTNIIYAGSDRVSKSTDGGHSWKTVFPPHPTPNGRDVSALAIAPTRPEAIYAIIGDFGPSSSTPANGRTTIYKSTDAGTTWQATTVVRGSVAPTALAVDPRDPTTVYAAIGANVMKTTNAGETWQPITARPPDRSTPAEPVTASPTGGVTALAVDPRRSGTVYAALTQGGIYKTTNGGQTWTRATSAGRSTCTATRSRSTPHARQRSTPQAKAKPGDGPQILRSTDSGHTWATAP